MDIASLSMGLAQSNLLTDVGTAMLSKSLDMATEQGESIVSLLDASALERSVNPDIGANIDILV